MATEYYASSEGGTLKDYIFSHEEEFKNALGTTNVELNATEGTITYKGKVYEVGEDGTITIAEGAPEPTPNPVMDGVEASTYYGQEIDYSVDLDDDTSTNDWKIFYNDGINVYIIASDYVENTHEAMPGIYQGETTNIGMSKNENYSIYWANETVLTEVKAGATNIFETTAPTGTKYIADKYLKTWKTAMGETMSANDNAKMTAALMDTEAWSGFAAGVSGAYAIGGPTVEMWVASWNTLHGSSSSDDNPQQLYCNKASTTGYYVGTTSSSTSTSVNSAVMSAATGYSDPLYYPHQEAVDGNACCGYWLTSPSAYDTYYEMWC